MVTSIWPSHEPSIGQPTASLAVNRPFSRFFGIWLLGFQAVCRHGFHAFDFLGDGYGGSLLSRSDSYSRRQGNHAFVGFNLDVGAWDAFFSQQVGLDLGGDPGVGSRFFGFGHFTSGYDHRSLSRGLSHGYVSQGQGQSSGGSSSNSKLLHTSNSCFSQNLRQPRWPQGYKVYRKRCANRPSRNLYI